MGGTHRNTITTGSLVLSGMTDLISEPDDASPAKRDTQCIQLEPLCDDKGFLSDWQSWTPEIAQAFAGAEGVQLTEAHWEIIYLLREFYCTYESSPANRALVKFVAKHLGKERGNSLYLLSLFHTSPARVGSRIAGLPKPKNCL